MKTRKKIRKTTRNKTRNFWKISPAAQNKITLKIALITRIPKISEAIRTTKLLKTIMLIRTIKKTQKNLLKI